VKTQQIESQKSSKESARKMDSWIMMRELINLMSMLKAKMFLYSWVEMRDSTLTKTRQGVITSD